MPFDGVNVRALVNELYRRTDEGGIDWDASEMGNRFTTQLRALTISVGREYDAEKDVERYYLEVQEIGISLLRVYNEEPWGQHHGEPDILQLFVAARAKSLKAAEKISELVEEREDQREVGGQRQADIIGAPAKKKRSEWKFLWSVILLLIGVAFGVFITWGGALLDWWTPGEARVGEQILVVFAASSLQDAFSEIATQFEAAHPGIRVRCNFAGTQALAAQLENGAAADVFASADLRYLQRLEAAGLVGKGEVFATNHLVVAVPRQGAAVSTLADLARAGVRIVAADPSVPAGSYTDQVLANLSRSQELPADFASMVEANIVSREFDVKSVLAKVLLGEADAGFVYASDLAGPNGDRVRALPIPPGMNVPASYAIGEATGCHACEAARDFIAFVRSEAGQSVLGRWGFEPVRN